MPDDAFPADLLDAKLAADLAAARHLAHELEDHRRALARSHPKSLGKVDLAKRPAGLGEAARGPVLAAHAALLRTIKAHRRPLDLCQVETADLIGALTALCTRLAKERPATPPAPPDRHEAERALTAIRLRFAKAMRPLLAKTEARAKSVRTAIAAQRKVLHRAGVATTAELRPYLAALTALERASLAYPTP
ncbi:MAG: hypothetical protein AAGC57_03880 [Pseudomonadota bacterium]